MNTQQNSIERFVRDAKKGGWKKGWTLEHVDSVFVSMKKKSEIKQPVVSWMIERVLLDKDAWVACGKTRGWNDKKFYEDGLTRITWKREWHRFITHLAEEKTLEEALNEIE